MSHLLSLIFFWEPEKIKTFFHDLCEILKQKNDKPDQHGTTKSPQIIVSTQTIDNIVIQLDSQRNQDLCFPSKDGWLKEVDDPIGQYLKLFNSHCKKSYTTTSLYDLLRACRNLVSHKFGNRPDNIKKFTDKELENLDDLEDEVRKVLKDHFGIKYWAEKFPEFLLLAYEAGFNVTKNLDASTQQNFGETFFEGTTVDPPNSLEDFQNKFANWVHEERNRKTNMWLSQITLPDQKEILFLTIPSNSKLQLKSREMITLTAALDDKGSKLMQLSRNMVFPNDEETCKFELNSRRSKLITSEYQCLDKKPQQGFQLTLPLRGTALAFPFCIFTDIITPALALCTNSETDSKFTVFTHCSTKHIERKVKEFFKLRDIEPKFDILYWEKLEADLKTKLLNQNFPIHMNSEFHVNLNKIQHFSSYNLNGLFGEKLIGLIHYKSQGLLNANTYQFKNYIKRSLLTTKNKPIDEEELLTLVHNILKKPEVRAVKYSSQANTCPNCLIVISDIAGMGKSTLLNYLGHLLIKRRKLVKYMPAKDFVTKIADSVELKQCTDIWPVLKNVWRENEFEQNVARYLMKSEKLDLSLLVDGIDELESDNDRTKLFLCLRYLLNNDDSSLTTNVYVTTKPHLVDDIKQLNTSNSHVFKINKFDDDDDFINCIIAEWSDFRKSEDDKKRHEIIARQCLKSCQDLGQFADTPFACGMIAEVYQSYAINMQMSEENIYDISKLYELFYNGLLREHVKKVIQKPNTSKHLLLESFTLNTNSYIFQDIKKLFYTLNIRLSIISRFGYDSSVIRELDNITSFTTLDTEKEKPFVILADGYFDTFGNFFFSYYIIKTLLSQTQSTSHNEVNSFIENELFKVRKSKNGKILKNKSLLRFINSFLKNEPNLTFSAGIKASRNALYYCIINKFNYVFIAIVNGLAENDENQTPWKKTIDETANAVEILHIAVKNNHTKVITYLSKIAGLDINIKHPRSGVAFQWALFVKKEDRENIIKCLLENNADLVYKHPRTKRNLFEMACTNKDIRDKIIGIMIEYDNYNTLNENWESWENQLKEKRLECFNEFQKLYMARNSNN